MKKTDGYNLFNVLISLTIVLMLSGITFFYWRDYHENLELKRAKIEIYEFFSTYSTKAFTQNTGYHIKMDFLKREFEAYSENSTKLETLKLPKNLKYATVFENMKQDYFEASITQTGNITPSFSIYIFNYKDIAKYRVSFYGFGLIKYLKINIYKNLKDKNATYKNITDFHKNWNSLSPNWKEE